MNYYDVNGKELIGHYNKDKIAKMYDPYTRKWYFPGTKEYNDALASLYVHNAFFPPQINDRYST